MSGLPDSGGVKEFRALLAQMAETSERSKRLRTASIAAEEGAKKADEEFAVSKNALFTLIEEMDMKYSGNYGWENRMTWFLVELQNQYAKDSK